MGGRAGDGVDARHQSREILLLRSGRNHRGAHQRVARQARRADISTAQGRPHDLLRREDGRVVRAEDIEKLARWDARKVPDEEIAFMPARVLLQDFTGVPAVVDLAAMRDAIVQMGGDPKRVNPLLPAELVIDHSVIVDEFGTPRAFEVNADLEFQRNRERYALLRWAQKTFA